MTRHRVAIAGAGIGAEHLAGYQAQADRFEVVAVCDLDLDRARAMAGPGRRIEADLGAVLADPEVDIVDICLPPHLHLEATLAALAAGKHVICEKPLAASLAEVDRMAEAARAAGRQVFPVFQYRFGTGAARLRRLIDAGLAGKPFVATLETHWNRGADYYATPWRGTWAGERGGAILGHAIHLHDWLSFAMGPVAQVFADLGTRVNPIETEDCAALSIRMESGALVTSSVTLGAADDTSRLRFCFEGVTVESDRVPYAPAMGDWVFRARAPVAQADVDREAAAVADAPSGFAGLFAAVADALEGAGGGAGGAAVSLVDGRRSVEFVTAVYASARAGAPVAMGLGPDHPCYGGWGPG